MSDFGPLELALAQPSGQPGFFQTPLPALILVFAVFYLLLIRPQQKRAKEHKAMVAGLKKNDRVITSGGLYGRITEVGEATVTLEIAPNVQVRYERSQIGVLQKDKEKKEG